MRFEEAWDTEVSRRAAMWEIIRHGGEWGDFLTDCGDKDVYLGSVVLGWLGY